MNVLFSFFLILGLASALELPKFTPNVVDETGTLTQQEILQLNQQIQTILVEKKLRPALLLIKTTDGKAIEDVANDVFHEWKLGIKGVDNGVLIIVAKEDRKMRIEIGYGLEGSLTDYYTQEIIRLILQPQFRDHQYYLGLSKALAELSLGVKGEPTILSRKQVYQQISLRAEDFLIFYFLLPALFYWVAFIIFGLLKPLPFQTMLKDGRISMTAFMFGTTTWKNFFIKLFFGTFFGAFMAIFPVAIPEKNVISAMVYLEWALYIQVYVAMAVAFFILSNKKYFLRREKVAGHSSSGSRGSSTSDTAYYMGESSSSSVESSDAGGGGSDSSSGGGDSGGGGSSGDW